MALSPIRRTPIPAVMLALATVLSGLGLAPASTGDRCVFVPFQGESCPVPGGWRIPLPGGGSVLTHGADPVPAELPSLAASVAAPVPPACVDDPLSDYHGLAVYAHPNDSPSRYREYAPVVRRMVELSNAMLRAEAAGHGRTLDYRMACTDGMVAVAEVPLSTPLARTTFQSMIVDLQKLGYASSLAKYWIWVDGHPPGAPGGFGTIEPDHRPDPANRNNHGPSYGVTWGFTHWPIMMHENGHNLGAVQDIAPNSSGAWHCNDGQDIMCYADGGPRSEYTSGRCGVVRFDCGGDDYFNPAPGDESHMNFWWNLGSPINRFVQGCLYESRSLLPAAGGFTATIAVGGCAGRAFSLSATFLRPPYSVSPAVRTTTSVSVLAGAPVLADVDVCWHGADGTELECFRRGFAEAGVVPPAATTGVVTLRQGGSARSILSII